MPWIIIPMVVTVFRIKIAAGRFRGGEADGTE
jgi:hypothetical protein